MAKILLLVFLLPLVFATQNNPNVQEGNEWTAAWGNMRAAFQNIGSWFTRQYDTVQGWFATSKEQLEEKVQNMVDFLGDVKNATAESTNQQIRAATQNVNKYYDDVVQFQNKLRSDASANFQTLEDEWQTKVQNMYNGGLDKIVAAVQSAKSQPSKKK